jgi:hypothetical protein
LPSAICHVKNLPASTPPPWTVMMLPPYRVNHLEDTGGSITFLGEDPISRRLPPFDQRSPDDQPLWWFVIGARLTALVTTVGGR